MTSATGTDRATGPLPADHIMLSPERLGAWRLPNRILVAPMTRTRAAVDGTPSELMAEFYAQRDLRNDHLRMHIPVRGRARVSEPARPAH